MSLHQIESYPAEFIYYVEYDMKIIIGIIIALLLVLQYQLWVAPGSWSDVRRLQKQVVKEQQANSEQQSMNEALAADVHDLRDGKQAIEERARSKLGLIKQDETFYQVIDHKDP